MNQYYNYINTFTTIQTLTVGFAPKPPEVVALSDHSRSSVRASTNSLGSAVVQFVHHAYCIKLNLAAIICDQNVQ